MLDDKIKDRLNEILTSLTNPLSPDLSFVDLLKQYSNLYASVRREENRKAISELFWNRISEVGTPFIEEIDESKVKVHFLFPREEYNHPNKILYIAGDFHGFGSTNNKRQLMSQFDDTDIMYRSDDMPKNSVVSYHYLQIDHEFADKDRPFFSGPSETLPNSFYPKVSVGDNFVSPKSATGQDPFMDAHLADKFSKHKHVPMTANPIFCANLNNDISSLEISSINWPKLLSHDCGLQWLNHKATYLSDLHDNLVIDQNIHEKYNDKLFQDNEHARAISVFEPISGKVENLVVVCDGAAYMGSNLLGFIDKSIQEDQLPQNTAVVFVTVMPGLLKKYDLPDHNDPRAVEFGTRVEDFAIFLNEQVITGLGFESVPPDNRTIVASSLAGAAGLYMGLEHQDVFGKVIAQAVGPYYREILDPFIKERMKLKKLGCEEDLSNRIQLCCGRFDSLEHAQNLYLAHTQALADVLGSSAKGSLPIQMGNYGHAQFQRWSQAVSTSLKLLYKEQLAIDVAPPLQEAIEIVSSESKPLYNFHKTRNSSTTNDHQPKRPTINQEPNLPKTRNKPQ